MKAVITFFLLLLILAVIFPWASAQFAQNLAVVFDPPFPKVGGEVTAKAVLTGADSSLSSFEWYKNGRRELTASGKGKNTFTFRLGPEARTVIDSVAITPDGSRLLATQAITRERPILLWWADTSSPAWYKGKASPSSGSTVTIFAVPGSGFGERSSDLVYSWSVNVEPRPEISGTGRDHFTLKVSRVSDVIQQVNIRISNSAKTIAQEATLLLPTIRPEILVYKLLPTGGIDFSKLVTLFAGESGGTFDFAAVPFFFRSDHLSTLKYNWRINDRALDSTAKDPHVLSLKTRSGDVSQNAITVRAAGSGADAQEAESAFTASFR